MKIFSLLLTVLFLTLLEGASPFSSGGVAVDWAKYDPKPQVEVKSSVNFVKNGSFEEQTDFKGSRGKGFWTAGSRAHGLKNTPANQAFKQRFSQAVIRRIRKDGAAEGKAFLFLKTPDEVKDWLKPFPQISNRLGQTVPVTVEKEGFYRLSFKAKGRHTPTAPNRGLFLIQVVPKNHKNTSRSRKHMAFGVQKFFSLRPEWNIHNFDFKLPAGEKELLLTLSLYGAGEACLDDVRIYPVAPPPASAPVRVKVMP